MLGERERVVLEILLQSSQAGRLLGGGVTPIGDVVCDACSPNADLSVAARGMT